MAMVRIFYGDYKKKYHDRRSADYNPSDKTIAVEFSDEEISKMPNLGNRYRMRGYRLQVTNGGEVKECLFGYKAMDEEHAIAQCKKDFPKKQGFSNWEVVRIYW